MANLCVGSGEPSWLHMFFLSILPSYFRLPLKIWCLLTNSRLLLRLRLLLRSRGCEPCSPNKTWVMSLDEPETKNSKASDEPDAQLHVEAEFLMLECTQCRRHNLDREESNRT